MPPPTPFLDHLVLLLPYATLSSLPPWLTTALHVLPGGRHADNRTENKLVVLPDGTYLELIAFLPHVPPRDRLEHKWGAAREGRFVDFAFSLDGRGRGESEPDRGAGGGDRGPAEKAFAAIRNRVNAAAGDTGVEYADPVPGGRTRGDGAVVRWANSQAWTTTTAAAAATTTASKSTAAAPRLLDPGTLPFWCLDRTPRRLRVPSHEPGNVSHPSGAVGVAGVDVAVDDGRVLRPYELIFHGGTEEENGDDSGSALTSSSGVEQEEDKGDFHSQGVRRFRLRVPSEEGGEAARFLTVRFEEGRSREDGGEAGEKIRLALLTEKGGERRTIGGEVAKGVELWIELRPRT